MHLYCATIETVCTCVHASLNSWANIATMYQAQGTTIWLSHGWQNTSRQNEALSYNSVPDSQRYQLYSYMPTTVTPLLCAWEHIINMSSNNYYRTNSPCMHAIIIIMGSILILYNLFTWLEMHTKPTTIYIVTSRVTEVAYSCMCIRCIRKARWPLAW